MATVVRYENNNYLVVGNSIGLFAVQAVAALTLVSPGALTGAWNGYRNGLWARSVPLLQYSDSCCPRTRIGRRFVHSPVLVPITAGLAVTLGVIALLTATGRALLPIVAALAGAILVAKYGADGWGNSPPGGV